MEKSIVEKSLFVELDEEIRKYKLYCEDLEKTKNTFETYKSISRDKILSMFSMLDIQSRNGVKIEKEKLLSLVTVEELQNAFNDKTMANLVVVKVDVQKTIENMKYKLGYSESIVKGFLDLLLELYEIEYDDLKILR